MWQQMQIDRRIYAKGPQLPEVRVIDRDQNMVHDGCNRIAVLQQLTARRHRLRKALKDREEQVFVKLVHGGGVERDVGPGNISALPFGLWVSSLSSTA